MIIIVALVIYIFKYFYDINSSKKISKLLNESTTNKVGVTSNMTNEANNTIIEDNNITEEPQNSQIPEKSERIIKLENLQKENSDIVALIEIENTDINYPVLQGNDNSYYMKHNYKKQYSVNGSIFLDKDYLWDPPSSNLLIYGHNNKNDTMFQSLLKYKDKKYYNLHPEIRFTTNDDDSIYEIFAVFESRVYYKSEKNVFRYYYFLDSKNEAEYNDFVNNCKSASLYNINITPKYEEQLLTLSTCSYHVKDGRFAVVAKQKN